MRCFPLPLRNAFDSGSDNLSYVGTLVYCYAYRRREEFVKQFWFDEKDPHKVFNCRRGAGYGFFNAEIVQYLAAEKEVKNKDKNNGRDVADKLHVHPPDKPAEGALANPQDSHKKPYSRAENNSPYTEFNRHHEAAHDRCCDIAVFFFIKTEKVLGDYVP